MVEIPDYARRAMEAAGVDPDEVAVLAENPPEEPPEIQHVRSWEEGDVAGDQLALVHDGALVAVSYENFLNRNDVLVYKRVKRQTMQLAHEAREIAAELIGGTVGDGQRSRKEFIETRLGKFRLSMGAQSDNTTEANAHDQMGVETIRMSDPAIVIAWFARHDLDGEHCYRQLLARLRAKFQA